MDKGVNLITGRVSWEMKFDTITCYPISYLNQITYRKDFMS